MRKDVWCADCGEGAELQDTNRMFGLPEVLIKHAALIGSIAPLADALGEIGLEGSLALNRDVRIADYEWFAKHAAHRLEPREW